MQGRTIGWALAAGGLLVAAGWWLVVPEAAPHSERSRVALPTSEAVPRAAEGRAASRPAAPAGEREGRHREDVLRERLRELRLEVYGGGDPPQ